MLLSKKQLLGLRVITSQNQRIGTVVDFSFDTKSHSLVQYRVRLALSLLRLSPPFLKNPFLLLHHKDVLHITNQELVVADSSLPFLLPSLCPHSSTDRIIPS